MKKAVLETIVTTRLVRPSDHDPSIAQAAKAIIDDSLTSSDAFHMAFVARRISEMSADQTLSTNQWSEMTNYESFWEEVNKAFTLPSIGGKLQNTLRLSLWRSAFDMYASISSEVEEKAKALYTQNFHWKRGSNKSCQEINARMVAGRKHIGEILHQDFSRCQAMVKEFISLVQPIMDPKFIGMRNKKEYLRRFIPVAVTPASTSAVSTIQPSLASNALVDVESAEPDYFDEVFSATLSDSCLHEMDHFDCIPVDPSPLCGGSPVEVTTFESDDIPCNATTVIAPVVQSSIVVSDIAEDICNSNSDNCDFSETLLYSDEVDFDDSTSSESSIKKRKTRVAWTVFEDNILEFGVQKKKKFSEIAKELPGRSSKACSNHYNEILKRKPSL